MDTGRQGPIKCRWKPRYELDTKTSRGFAERWAISGANVWCFWGSDPERTTSIRGKHPVETVISPLHHRGGIGRDRRTEMELKRKRERESTRESLTRSTKQLKATRLLCILAKTCTLFKTGKTQYFNTQWDMTVAKGKVFKVCDSVFVLRWHNGVWTRHLRPEYFFPRAWSAF